MKFGLVQLPSQSVNRWGLVSSGQRSRFGTCYQYSPGKRNSRLADMSTVTRQANSSMGHGWLSSFLHWGLNNKISLKTLCLQETLGTLNTFTWTMNTNHILITRNVSSWLGIDKCINVFKHQPLVGLIKTNHFTSIKSTLRKR